LSEIQKDAKRLGYNNIKNEDIRNVIKSLLELDLLKMGEKPLDRLNINKVIYNLHNFEKGLCSITDSSITITNICPYNCKYCFRKKFNEKKESILEKEIIIEAIKDISLLGGISLNFTGGEVSLFPEAIAEYARIARNYGFKKISVSTS
jgi:sulfatase maturation enzyme AslB (radical SAM superfamily)